MKKQLFYTFICFILLSKLFSTQLHFKYSMHPHVNIRFSHNHNENWKYYKATYDGIGYLLNKYIEKKLMMDYLKIKSLKSNL